MQIAFNIATLVSVFVLGVLVGSCLTVLIYRLPRKLAVLRGLPCCPHCAHPLGIRDRIPLVSYLLLRRRCRFCHAPLSVRGTLVELGSGVLALLSWWAFCSPEPLLRANPQFLGAGAAGLAALVYFAALALLLVITCIDTDTMEIPNVLTLALALCGILSIFAGPELGLVSRLIGLVVISLPLFVLLLLVPNAFGGGDVKLMAAAGILLGWQATLVAAFIGIILGGIYGVFLLVTRRKGAKEHFAFGPALCLGIATALFYAPSLIPWYLRWLGW